MGDLIPDIKKSAQRWTLTIWNNPCQAILPENVTYFLAVKETCPTTGKAHWQSYMEFHQPVKMGTIKKIFDKTVSCRTSRGSGPQNVAYCKKTVLDSTPVEDGETFREYGSVGPGQGARTDLRGAKRKRDEGEWTMEDVMHHEPQLAMQYRNGWRDVEKYAQRNKSMKIDQAEVVDKWCDTDEEMALAAREYVGMVGGCFILPESGLFDEYQGQSTLVTIGPYMNGLSEARLKFPIPQALPGKYNTTYPAWTKVVRIMRNLPG